MSAEGRSPLRSIGWGLFSLRSDRRRLEIIDREIDDWISRNEPPPPEENRLQDQLETEPDNAGAAEILARNAIELARMFRERGHDDWARRILHEASLIYERAATLGEPDALRALGDVLTEAGRKEEAIAWYQHAAEAGNREAVNKATTLLLTFEFPRPQAEAESSPPVAQNQQDDPRELILMLSPPEQQVIAQRYLWQDAPSRTAKMLGITEPELTEYESQALLALDRQFSRPARDLDKDFDGPGVAPGQVIGGRLTEPEKTMINLMDPKDRARYLLQRRIQEKADMTILLDQLQSLRRQTMMSIKNNVR